MGHKAALRRDQDQFPEANAGKADQLLVASISLAT
jgi:hypothetical protein